MLSPEDEVGREPVPQSESPEDAPLSEAEQAELAELYRVAPATEAVPEAAAGPESSEELSVAEEMTRLGAFSSDPSEFSAFIARHVGDTYTDPFAGDMTIRPAHVAALEDINTDIGQAIGLLKDGGSPETIQRLVDSAYGKIGTLPNMFQNPLSRIIVRYYDNAKASN